MDGDDSRTAGNNSVTATTEAPSNVPPDFSTVVRFMRRSDARMNARNTADKLKTDDVLE